MRSVEELAIRMGYGRTLPEELITIVIPKEALEHKIEVAKAEDQSFLKKSSPPPSGAAKLETRLPWPTSTMCSFDSAVVARLSRATASSVSLREAAASPSTPPRARRPSITIRSARSKSSGTSPTRGPFAATFASAFSPPTSPDCWRSCHRPSARAESTSPPPTSAPPRTRRPLLSSTSKSAT